MAALAATQTGKRLFYALLVILTLILHESITSISNPTLNLQWEKDPQNPHRPHNNTNSMSSLVESVEASVPSAIETSIGSSACNCLDPDCPRRSCHRGLIAVHKMGVTLLGLVRDHYLEGVSMAQISNNTKQGANFNGRFRSNYQLGNNTRDYRHVIVSRNWYDSIISGYLYHRRGMECGLDWFGKPGFKGWLLDNRDENWESRLISRRSRAKDINGFAFPPGEGRDLCTYMSQESEEDGLRVYTEWALDLYLEPLLEYVREVRQAEGSTRRKTMHLCFEKLETNYTNSVHAIFQWLHPGVLKLPKVNPTGKTDRDPRDHNNTHSNEKTPDLLSRLRRIIKDVDGKFFNHTIALGSQELGCLPATS